MADNDRPEQPNSIAPERNPYQIVKNLKLTELRNLLSLATGGFVGSFYWVSPYLGQFWGLLGLIGIALFAMCLPCLILSSILQIRTIRDAWALAFVVYLGVFIGAFIEVTGFRAVDLKITKHYCESFVPKLNEYQAQHGIYPPTLEVSLLDNLMAPGFASRKDVNDQICDYGTDSKKFWFGISTGMLSGIGFDSKSGRWSLTGD